MPAQHLTGGPAAQRTAPGTLWECAGASGPPESRPGAGKPTELAGSGEPGGAEPGKLDTGHEPSSESLPTASANLCTDVNASPFLSANTTRFLGLWGSGGRARQERKDDWGRCSLGPGRLDRRSCCRHELWLRQKCMGQCKEDTLATLESLTDKRGRKF